MNYWLVKTDPETYSWDDFVIDGETSWDGIRNYAARNHLRSMKKGDKVLVYHSGGDSEVKGLATVTKESYQDPTTKEVAWLSVGLKAGKKFSRGVTLKEIKTKQPLKKMLLITISRLSVMPITEKEFETILEMSET